MTLRTAGQQTITVSDDQGINGTPVKNFDVVYPLVDPNYYLAMAGGASCHPQYAGVGITMGIDQVAQVTLLRVVMP